MSGPIDDDSIYQGHLISTADRLLSIALSHIYLAYCRLYHQTNTFPLISVYIILYLASTETISTIVFLLDLVLFTTITLTFFTRWIMFPGPTRKMFDTDVDQTTYLSCGTIAAATLVELVALIPGAHWNNWGYVAYALWWAVVALALLGGSVVYWILIRDEEVHLGNLSPTLLYPVTGILATSAAGAVVVSYNTDIGPRLGVGVVIVSYLLLGMGESQV